MDIFSRWEGVFMLEDKNGRIKIRKLSEQIEKILDKFLWIGLLLFYIISILLIIVGIYFWCEIVSKNVFMFILVCIYFIIPGILFFSVTMAFTSRLYVKYEIKSDGLWAKYPLEPLKIISWNEFQEVCVCYAGHHNGRAHSVICCVKKGEKENIFTGRWKMLNPYKFRSVITMEYTDELYEEFKEKCPYPVKDLRNTRKYKIY